MNSTDSFTTPVKEKGSSTLTVSTVSRRRVNVSVGSLENATFSDLRDKAAYELGLDADNIKFIIDGMPITAAIAQEQPLSQIVGLRATSSIVAIGVKSDISTPIKSRAASLAFVEETVAPAPAKLPWLHKDGLYDIVRLLDSLDGNEDEQVNALADHPLIPEIVKYLGAATGRQSSNEEALQEVLDVAEGRCPPFVDRVRSHSKLFVDVFNGRKRLTLSGLTRLFDEAAQEAADEKVRQLFSGDDDISDQRRQEVAQIAREDAHDAATMMTELLTVLANAMQQEGDNDSSQQEQLGEGVELEQQPVTEEMMVEAEIAALNEDAARAQQEKDYCSLTFAHYRLFHCHHTAAVKEVDGSHHKTLARSHILQACKGLQLALTSPIEVSVERLVSIASDETSHELDTLANLVSTTALLFFARQSEADPSNTPIALSVALWTSALQNSLNALQGELQTAAAAYRSPTKRPTTNDTMVRIPTVSFCGLEECDTQVTRLRRSCVEDSATAVLYSHDLPYEDDVATDRDATMALVYGLQSERVPSARTSFIFVVAPNDSVSMVSSQGLCERADGGVSSIVSAWNRRGSGLNVALAWSDRLRGLYSDFISPVEHLLPSPAVGTGDAAHVVFFPMFCDEESLPFHAFVAPAAEQRDGLISSPRKDDTIIPGTIFALDKWTVSVSCNVSLFLELRSREPAPEVRSCIQSTDAAMTAWLTRQVSKLINASKAGDAESASNWSIYSDDCVPARHVATCDLFLSSSFDKAVSSSSCRCAILPVWPLFRGEDMSADHAAFHYEFFRHFVQMLLPTEVERSSHRTTAPSIATVFRRTMLFLKDLAAQQSASVPLSAWVTMTLFHYGNLPSYNLRHYASKILDQQYEHRIKQATERLQSSRTTMRQEEQRQVAYLNRHNIPDIFESMVCHVLDEKPSNTSDVFDALIDCLGRLAPPSSHSVAEDPILDGEDQPQRSN